MTLMLAYSFISAYSNLEAEIQKKTQLMAHKIELAQKEKEVAAKELESVNHDLQTEYKLLEKEQERAKADLENLRENKDELVEKERDSAAREAAAAHRELESAREMSQKEVEAILKKFVEIIEINKRAYEIMENDRKQVKLCVENFYGIAGRVRSGKLSLINSLRGFNRFDEGAAEVDNVESTFKNDANSTNLYYHSCDYDHKLSLGLIDSLEIVNDFLSYQLKFKNNGATPSINCMQAKRINIDKNPRKYRRKSKKPKNRLCLTCPPLNRTERSNQIAKNQHLNEKIWNLFNWFFLYLTILATKYVENANNVRVVIFYGTKFSNNFKICWHRIANPKFSLEETFIDMLNSLYQKFSFSSIFLENRFHRYNNHVLIRLSERRKKLLELKFERLKNLKNRRAKQNDVQELLEIKNKYEDVLKGKPMKNKQRSYTTSQYIRARCDSNDCLCYEQERELNNSFNNLPSEASQQDSVIIYERFNEQVLSWINSTYKCAPCLRSSCKMIATSDFLYIFGGSNPSISEKALRDVYKFNILTRKWKKLKVSNLPTSLISFAICWDPNPIDDRLIGYLFGGAKDPDGYEISDELFKFQIDSEGSISFQNVEIDKLARPTPRCGCSMVMAHGKLYLIGGVDNESYLSDVWVLDMQAKKLEWRELKVLSKSQPNSQIVEKASGASDSLRGRYTHELILIDDLILIIGGGDDEWTIDAFDIKSKVFIKIETLPDKHYGFPGARKYFSVVKDGKDIYGLGGWLDNDGITRKGITDEEDAILFDDIWKLSQITVDGETHYQWTKLPTKLKLPLFFHASAITPEGCIYTFGGCIDAKSMYPSNKLQRFWIKPPELRQISMFKMVVNNPHLIEDFEKKEVMELNNKVLNTYSRSSNQELVNLNSTEWMEDNVHELLQTRPNRLIQLLWQ